MVARAHMFVAGVAVSPLASVMTACSGGDSASGCPAAEVASSPEKIGLVTNLADGFNGSKEAKTAANGGCGRLHVDNVSSGAAEQQLADGWPTSETTVAQPVIWTPAASAWGAVLNDVLVNKGQPAMAPADAKPIMRTPLVFAMP